jgi:catechol 2,3-dioxygenase-like lactoylglutathione lyase family enzyme
VVGRAVRAAFLLATAAFGRLSFFHFGLFGKDIVMGILEAAKPAVIICTRDRERAKAFYRDILGLPFSYQDNLAVVFNIGSITVRLSKVPGFTAHEHTILGFTVPHVESTVKALRDKGCIFNLYPAFRQDELGILTLPGGAVQVAWLKDPDGNVLSITNA